MMDTAKMLRAFCAATDERRLDLPFSYGAFTYATDLVIAIRVARVAGVETRNATEEGTTAHTLSMQRFPVEGECLFPLPALPARAFEICPERLNFGEAYCKKTCPECGGTGRVVTVQRVQIGVHDFNSEYLRSMKMFLSNVRTDRPQTANGRLAFTFDLAPHGGCGMLAAMEGPL